MVSENNLSFSALIFFLMDGITWVRGLTSGFHSILSHPVLLPDGCVARLLTLRDVVQSECGVRDVTWHVGNNACFSQISYPLKAGI